MTDEELRIEVKRLSALWVNSPSLLKRIAVTFAYTLLGYILATIAWAILAGLLIGASSGGASF